MAKTAEGSDAFINDSEKGQTTPIWTLTASGSSSIDYTVALSDTAAAQVCDGGDTYNQGSTIPGASSLASDGAWTLCVRLSDAAGNITYGKGDQIVRDIGYPVFTSLAVANAASDTYINDSEKLLTNSLWSLSASDQTATDYTIALDDSGGALTCTGAKNYDQASIPRPSDLSSDGPYGLCVRLTDAAGNITYGKSAQITRDIIFPVFSSLNGANEASDLTIQLGEQTSNLAAFALVASGHSSDDFTIALSDSPSAVTCNSSPTYDQADVPLISSIASDGAYAVCAKISDAAGNNSYGKSQQLTRDTQAPVFTSLTAANAAADGYINDGEKSSANPAWALSASDYAADAYTAPLADTGGALVCDVSKTYSGGSIPLISAMASDGPWSACVRLTDTAGNITYGKAEQIIRDIAGPGAPGSFTATAGNRTIDLSWVDSTGTPEAYLLVRGPVGSAPTFVPTTGQIYAPGSQGSDQILYVGKGVSKFDANLLIGSTYHYKVFAYDIAGNYSAASSVSSSPVAPCASNYVFIPGDPDYGTSDLCAMKYEAKDVGGFASSQASSAPWVNIYQILSRTECTSVGFAYDLISNDEWMTISSRLAAQNSNWSGGTVGSGTLFRGHTDNNPTSACEASANDSLAYVETNCTPKAAGAGENDQATQRRTLDIGNGQVIWDLAGNVSEAVAYHNLNDKVSVSAGVEYTAISGTTTTNKFRLVPTNALKSFWIDTWNSGHGIGQFNGSANGSSGSMVRGGNFANGVGAGLFAASNDLHSSITSASQGFRCVQHLPDLDPASLALAAGDSQIAASWTATGGASGYLLIRGPAGSHPSFTPENGSSYGTGSQGADTIVYAGAALSFTDTELENGREYYYARYSYTAGHVYSAPSRSKDSPLGCPTDFVLVPSDPDYATNDFCVMKYEAKSMGGVAASTPLTLPWVYITQEASYTACSAMGPGYHLLSNSEWMAIGANIAGRAANWTSGVVGTNRMTQGHSDDLPPWPCAGSTNTNLGFVDTTCEHQAATADSADQKRIHTLSTGEHIWDIAGNVWDWTYYTNPIDLPGAAVATYQYTALAGTSTTPLSYLIPTNAVKSFWSDTWNSTQSTGTFISAPNGIAGAFARGGSWFEGINAGVFAVVADTNPSASFGNLGFRCALSGLAPETPRQLISKVDRNVVSLSWSQSSSTSQGYLVVRGEAGKLPLFQPADGTSYSTGAQGSDTIVYVGAGKTKLDTTVTVGGYYSYRVYAYDASHNYSGAALSSVYVSTCEVGWVLVPGDPDYGTQDTCIMKYEAKLGANYIPLPIYNGNPWGGASMESAMTDCATLGRGYHMINNDEWMTVASNIAAIGSNWTGGSVGSGTLFVGHSDNSPASVCEASPNDSLHFVETNCTAVGGAGDSADQRRTFTLSNNLIVWDLAGNASEWVNYHNSSSKPGATAAWYQYSALSGTTTMPLSYLVPTNALKSFWVDTWNATQNIGKLYPGTNGSGGGFIRGGHHNSLPTSTSAGIFGGELQNEPTIFSGGLGFRCAQTIADIDQPRLTLVPGNTTVSASWSSYAGASSYMLVRGPVNTHPSFSPDDGISYGVGAQGSDTILYTGTDLSFEDTGRTNGTIYGYALFAIDAEDNYTLIDRNNEMPVACPSGYSHVPGDNYYGTQDFCVMKYEAKNDGSGNAVSTATGSPWISITMAAAKTRCNAIGTGYDLISNDDWMTLGAHAAGLASNWTGGSVGSNSLVAGHNDNSPASTCAASANDTLYFVENNCTAVSSGDSAEQRRTLNLATNQVVWDFSGNVWEWVNQHSFFDKPLPATGAWTELPAISQTSRTTLPSVFPTNAIKSYWNDNWNSAQNVGLYYAGVNSSGGAFKRGGGFNNTTAAGVFTLNLNGLATSTAADLGYRCVKRR